MKFYVGVTDIEWFWYQKNLAPDDVNFWQPGGKTTLQSLPAGAPFLFKLKSPINAICGVAFFSSNIVLPINVAWEIFGEKNGVRGFVEFKNKILSYRKDKLAVNPDIGCIVLTNPVFFDRTDWIPIPSDWKHNIVQGRYYETEDVFGSQLWSQVELLLETRLQLGVTLNTEQLGLFDPVATPRFGKSILANVRLGQSAFRVLVTEAYGRRCSISGEKTLPVLEAAHIQPYSQDGPHRISNSLLLRSDIHKLFDTGYITVTTDYKINISSRIRSEFENGKDYYRFHGNSLQVLPQQNANKPGQEFLQYHNEKIFNE